jgi:DNA-binding NtrC family response regulator
MITKEGNMLIVDDNEELLLALTMYLKPHFNRITTLKNPGLIPDYISKEDYDLILLDMNFAAGITSGNEGIFWMRRILETDPNTSVVLITAFGDVELAVKAIKEGATDFIQKSWDEQKILSTILSAYKIRKSRQEIQRLKSKQQHLTSHLFSDHDICPGISDSMQKIFDTIDKIASTDANILILGENGTGKEVIAREIHKRSLRSAEIFVNVDLGSLHENLFESELFGYEQGAFTDAKSGKEGRFEIASGGTLYLDEIGNLPVSLQPKLLSAIQNRTITRLGSIKEIQVDIRLITATNKSLYEMAESGDFREDLLYRINTIQIDLPPLRERVEDIPVLADHFLKKFTGKYHKEISGISRTGLEKLKKHNWFGNIRELEHSIEKAVILSERVVLEPGDFQFYSRTAGRELVESYNLAENEKRLIQRALRKYSGNISSTAKELGINRSTLYEKIKKYGL